MAILNDPFDNQETLEQYFAAQHLQRNSSIDIVLESFSREWRAKFNTHLAFRRVVFSLLNGASSAEIIEQLLESNDSMAKTMEKILMETPVPIIVPKP